MKFPSILLLIFLSLLTFSCTDNLAEIGANIQPGSDDISIGTGIFNVTTKDSLINSIVSNSSYFLLGNFTDSKYGSTRAEILAQLMHPLEPFNPGTVIDRAEIILTYSFLGDTVSPIRISIYEMNKKTFLKDTTTYRTNIDPTEFCDQSILLGQKSIRIKNNTLEKGTDTTHINLSKTDAERLFKLKDYYNSDADFLNNFKGIYLKSDFGASTMLYLHKTSKVEGISNEILIRLYTHYNYKLGNDTTIRNVKIQRDYPANMEVKQVNRIQHPDINTFISNNINNNDSNYISSPANIYTKVTIPLKAIRHSMDSVIGSKKRIINKALLKVEVTRPNYGLFTQPLVGKLLLIKKDSVDYFFNNKILLANSTSALVSSVTSALNATTNTTEYYYTYDLAKLLTAELKKASTDKIEMLLVPVQQMYSLYYAPSSELSAVTIKSGKNKTSPMRIKMIYSGF
jgi:hypothetical protein